MKLLARIFGGRPADPSDTAPSADDHLRTGNSLLEEDKLNEAATAYRSAIQASPALVGAHVNLGFVLSRQGLFAQAEEALGEALRLAPSSHDAHYLMGLALVARHAHALALPHLRQAIALEPSLMPAYADLGKALHDVGLYDEAREVLKRGLAIDPNAVQLLLSLGNVELGLMAFEDALATYRKVLALAPGIAAAHANVAIVLNNLADFEGAAIASRTALALDPHLHSAHSNLVMTLSVDAGCSPAAYRAEAVAYGRRVAGMIGDAVRARTFLPKADDAPLRVGFVSGDLRRHPVGYFLLEVMRQWDRAAMPAIAYSNHGAHDELTAELKSLFDSWHDVTQVDDEGVVRLVEADRIDVLIDLSGHSPFNRLPMFARRAAPMQVSWLGYWASTGVETMDCLLADEVSLPRERRGDVTEQVAYLPHTRLCFTAPHGADVPAVSDLPSLRRGHLTFGSFQRLSKINDAVISLWARVLAAVPGSRLRLQSAQVKNPAARVQLQQGLAAHGIALDRVELHGGTPYNAYLAAHAEVDIILDTFPYGGGTTTCEGASMMTCAGLADWVAHEEDDYVRRAVALAGDLAALSRLRVILREQVRASPLFDGESFATDLQNTLRGLWRESAARAMVPGSTPGA
jgi:predicted O-linked N-acetylglucosamine transferase (SPINDLY family)